jgi:AraC-like DNA-binding protein
VSFAAPAAKTSFTRYDTTRVSPRERWDYWCDWYSEAVVSHMWMDRVETTPAVWDASVESLNFGDVMLSQVSSGAAYADWDLEGTEESGLVRVCLFYDVGRMTTNWHGQDFAVANGTALFHARSAGWWDSATGFRAIQVNVPRASLPLSDNDIDRIAREQNQAREPVFHAVVKPMLIGAVGRLRSLSTMSDATAGDLSATWVSAVSTLLLALRGQPTDGAETRPMRIAQARRYIRQNLARPDLDPESVARALSISRRSLYAMFAGEAGVAATIRQHRLEAAAAHLRDPAFAGHGIAQIGAMVGLADIAHFSRAFKSEFGMSPRAWRARHRELPMDGSRELS